MISYATFTPHEIWPENVIIPQQTHGARIVEIITGNEDLSGCDGAWTFRSNKGASPLVLGVLTADCAPVCIWDEEKFGIVHAGWRGLVGNPEQGRMGDGICEKILTHFDNPQVWVGPLFPVFEIQRDECWERIRERFGDEFFIEREAQIFFDFQKALQSVLPDNAQFDPRSTFETAELASWRRDRSDKRNLTIIGHPELVSGSDDQLSQLDPGSRSGAEPSGPKASPG